MKYAVKALEKAAVWAVAMPHGLMLTITGKPAPPLVIYYCLFMLTSFVMFHLLANSYFDFMDEKAIEDEIYNPDNLAYNPDCLKGLNQ